MKKLLFGLCFVLYLSACAMSTRMPYQVNSTPPGAQIYVDGVSMGMAPVQIELACDKRWFCPKENSCGWVLDDYEYEVTAHPAEDTPGLSQTKRVKACQLTAPAGQIDFDLRLNAVAPRQTIGINVTQNDNSTSLVDIGLTLKSGLDQGVVSGQEHEQGVDKTTKDDAR